jgi:hypothetical protein
MPAGMLVRIAKGLAAGPVDESLAIGPDRVRGEQRVVVLGRALEQMELDKPGHAPKL